MENKEKLFGILTTSNNYDQNLKLNIEVYKKIFNTYGNFCILNLSNFIIFKKKDKLPETKKYFFSKKIKVFKPKNLRDLKSIFKGKTFIAFNNIGKTFSYFKILFYLNFIDLKQILLLNIGYQSNKVNLDSNSAASFLNSLIYFLRRKVSYYIFRILTIINIFPKIEIYFESSVPTINSVNKGLSKKFESLFPFTKFSYFRSIYKINSRSYNLKKKKHSTSNKYICFVDISFEHLDRVHREGKISYAVKKKYYLFLKNLLINLKIIFKKKIIICIHPKNSDKLFLNYFKDFKIKKYQTSEIIKDSFIILFHESSAIMDAVILKKNIISLKSNLLGKYLSDRTKLYSNLLGLHSLELNKDYKINKKNLIKNLKKSKIKMSKYVAQNLQTDKKKPGEEKVIEVINKIFF